MATLPTSSALTSSSTTNAQQKTNWAAFRDFAADLLGTDSSNKTAARSALGVTGASRVMGLIGAPNSAAPTTRFDLKADQVDLRNSSSDLVNRFNPATLTVNLSTAGPAANGRDQAGAFAANSWIHLYFIWNGTTLATIASLAAPTTGPTLPSGYTHWAYATTIRWNASSNIIPVYCRGGRVYYDIADGGVNRILSAGQATTLSAISCSTLVPPNALRAAFGCGFILAHGSAQSFKMFVRPTGAANSGQVVGVARVPSPGTMTASDSWGHFEFPLISASIDYKIDNVPSSGGAYCDVMAYVIANGDA